MKKVILLASMCFAMAQATQAQTNLTAATSKSVSFVTSYSEVDNLTSSLSLPAISTASPNSINISSNPSTGTARIEIPSTFRNKGAALSIINLSGKEVFWHALDNQTAIPVTTNNFSKGIYFVRLQAPDGKALFQKLSLK